MKRNFTVFRNQVDHMPFYKRSHGSNKPESNEDIALSTHKKQIFLEKEIKSNDTLQSVSLEFNVPVAELKRINKIHKDNEIYARKIIKVPSNPLSILLDKEYFSKIDEPVEKPIQFAQENCDAIVETVNNSTCVSKKRSENDILEQDGFSYSSLSANELQESSTLLVATVENKANDVMTCSGADWGISWHALLVFTLVIGIGGPALYVFWLLWSKKEKLEES